VKRRLPIDLMGLTFLVAVCALAYWQRPQRPAPRPADPPAEADVAEEAVTVDYEVELELDDGTFAGAPLNREGVELARAGRMGEAAAKLRAALQASPAKASVRRNMQSVLTAWGLDELRQGQVDTAADRLTEALTFGRRNETLTGLGIAQLRRQQYGEAIRALDEAIQHGAVDAPTYMALGEAYEATDQRKRALEMFKRASEAGLRSPELYRRIARLGRDVRDESDFKADSSQHFDLRFDASEDPRVAREVLHSLELAYELVGHKFAYFPDRPTPVVIYAGLYLRDITEIADWAGAQFDGRLKFPLGHLVSGAELDRVTRHEYAHSLIAALAHDRVPGWLTEGLAMWAEELSPADRRGWAEQVLRGRKPRPLETLTQPFSDLPIEEVQTAYAQSYLTVLFLVDHYEARRVPRLLAALHRGETLAGAFREVYSLSLERFEEAAAQRLG
jgi:tetratricopeptide (TPR) repeat protein